MKIIILACCLSFGFFTAFAESRFDRPVIKVSDPSAYQFHKLDDVDYPTLVKNGIEGICIVYRGAEYYYVEVTIKNTVESAVSIPYDFIQFEKPGYTVNRTDSLISAREFASLAGEHFVPTPPPYVPPTYSTTVNATATTYGNQTQVNGMATATADYSGQAGANLGNAVGKSGHRKPGRRPFRSAEGWSEGAAKATELLFFPRR